MKKRNLRLDDILDFGKHQGCEVEDLLDDDPGWLVYMHEQDSELFDIEVIEAMEKRKLI